MGMIGGEKYFVAYFQSTSRKSMFNVNMEEMFVTTKTVWDSHGFRVGIQLEFYEILGNFDPY